MATTPSCNAGRQKTCFYINRERPTSLESIETANRKAADTAPELGCILREISVPVAVCGSFGYRGTKGGSTCYRVSVVDLSNDWRCRSAEGDNPPEGSHLNLQQDRHW